MMMCQMEKGSLLTGLAGKNVFLAFFKLLRKFNVAKCEFDYLFRSGFESMYHMSTDQPPV